MADETSTSPREDTTPPAPAHTTSAPAVTTKATTTEAATKAATTEAATATALTPPGPRLLIWEIVIVFAVSLGGSGLYALVQYIGSLTAQQSVSKQAVIVHGTLAPGRPLLDLFLQLTSIALALAPVLLVLYLLARSG